MKDFLTKLARTIEILNRVAYWLSALAILLSGLILTYEVVMRYVLNTPTIWEIEASIYLGIFATFMGAAYGLKEGAHVNVDLVIRALPAGIQINLQRVLYFLSLIFCLYVSYNGWKLWFEAFSKSWRSGSMWNPPLAIPYLFVPLGFTLLSFQFIIQIGKLSNKNFVPLDEKSTD